MAKVYLTRIEKFNAAHRLWVDEWSEEKNLEEFGKCANKNWHGHNYTLSVTVSGHPDPKTGFIVDVKKLSAIILSEVVDHLDHRNLNLDVPFTKGIMPTTENMVVVIWNQLANRLPGCQLHCVRLQETDKIYAEYYGE
ncbi:MAG TPA: 6-carboxytetrahydropterin synthase [Saprospiraceae bacterium]|nr:6-carboxytetrahydropterin synthase [Saprospiraceae bacterium]